MACSTPRYIYATISSLSGIYAFFSTIGHILVVLAIVIDPNKELRCRLNFWLVNISLADATVATLINGYRTASNYLRAIGADVGQYIANKSLWGKLCHVNLLAAQIIIILSLAAIFLDQFYTYRLGIKIEKKTGYKILGIVCAFTWVAGFGFSTFYHYHGYTIMEWVVVSISFIFSVFGLVLTYFLLYAPAARESTEPVRSRNVLNDRNDYGAEESKTEIVHSAVQESSHCNTRFQTSGATGSDTEAITCEMSSKNAAGRPEDNAVKIDGNEEQTECDPPTLKLRNAKGLLFVFALLFLCAGTAFVVIYAINLDAVSSCLPVKWMKGMRLLIVITDMALNPFCFMFFWPNVWRGVLGLLKLRRAAVAPAQ